MALRTRVQLETFFETNDFPTAAQFTDFIESCINITDDGELVGGEDNIEAFNGGGQANATQLTKRNNRVDTQTNPSDSVKLPQGVAGMVCSVWNIAGDPIDVFPFVGDIIYENAINIAEELGSTQYGQFNCVATGKWIFSIGG